jgi:2,4-diaminopentanoate dehydrogenase
VGHGHDRRAGAAGGHRASAHDAARVYVHADDKVNRDAGELCGMNAIGVAASGSIDEILELAPDCVLYMPSFPDLDELCRLLSSGINVVTTCGLFHHPSSMDPGVRARAEAACEAGSASIHSTGSSPGFITEAVPLVMTSIQRRLDSLTIDEYADLSRRNSPELLFGLMGFGRAPGSFEEYRAAYLQSSFGPSLQLVASAVGLPLDSLKAGGELAARAASENDVLLFRNRGLAETERTIDTLALLMTEC